MERRGSTAGWRTWPARIPGWLRTVVLVGVAIFVLMQFVPYGWSHPNPPVVDDALLRMDD